jgi:hypothetical protein
MPLTDDTNALIGILQFTEKLLDHLIARLSPDDNARFSEAWDNETRPNIHQAISTLQNVTDVTDPTWSKLVGAGLTGRSLALKRHYLAQAASDGFIKKFLKFLNGLLKSLISALPGAEPVKELKDYIESFFDDAPEPDSGLITLFNSGGFVPFAAP